MTEKAKKLGNQPAQPTIEFSQYMADCPFSSNTKNGLTKREQFAILAMQGLLSNSSIGKYRPDFDYVKEALSEADALLEQLSKE